MAIPKKITVEKIKGAFANTSVRTRVTLEEGLQDHKGEKLNTILEIVDLLNKFSTFILSADGGVRDFLIFYNFNDSLVFIDRFPISEHYEDIISPSDLVEYLNKQISKHILSAKLLVKELEYNETVSRLAEEHSGKW